MLNIFKNAILSKIEDKLQLELGVKAKFKKKAEGYYLIIESREGFFSYIGVNFFKTKDVVEPFVGWSRKAIKIPMARFKEVVINDKHFEEIISKHDVEFRHLDKVCFGMYTNISKEITPPNDDFFQSLRTDTEGVAILNSLGMYDDFFIGRVYQTWDFVCEIFNYQITGQDIDNATKEITEDINDTFEKIYIPYLKKVSSLISN